jgi:hypothetical protein
MYKASVCTTDVTAISNHFNKTLVLPSLYISESYELMRDRHLCRPSKEGKSEGQNTPGKETTWRHNKRVKGTPEHGFHYYCSMKHRDQDREGSDSQKQNLTNVLKSLNLTS